MARFTFSALDAREEVHSGTLDASDRAAALQNLSARFQMVTELIESRSTFLQGLRARLFHGVSQDELLIFTQQLSSVIAAGLPLKMAFEYVVGDSTNASLIRAVEQVSASIQQGSTVADALAMHPRIFPTSYVSMIKAGEASGKLPQSLDQLARQIESSANLASKVRGAFVYPIVVVVFACTLTVAILTFGIPMLREVYATLGGQLPLPTRVMIGLSDLLVRFWFLWVGGLVLALWTLKVALAHSGTRLALDRIKLNLPLLGTLFRFLATARFARNFGSVYKAGVPILEALDLAAPTVGTLVFQNILLAASRKVAEGATLSACLRSSSFLPPLALGMVSAGEASGSLDKMLEKVADFYEMRVEVMLKTLNSLIEPVLMIGVGLIMAVLILAMGLPFLNLAAAL